MRNEGLAVNTTNGVAVAGASTAFMPDWVSVLEQVAGVAGFMVPTLSMIWLGLQIGFFLHSKLQAFRDRRQRNA